MIPIEYDSKLERSKRHVALNLALGVPDQIKTPEHSAKSALCEILTCEYAYTPGQILALSDELLFVRDQVAPHESVIFDIASLSEHYGVDQSTMILICRLCGAMAFQRGNVTTVWADDSDATFVLDAEKIREFEK